MCWCGPPSSIRTGERAETYGPLKDLEALVDEYYEAANVDPRRLAILGKQIVALVRETGLDRDLGFAAVCATPLTQPCGTPQ